MKAWLNRQHSLVARMTDPDLAAGDDARDDDDETPSGHKPVDDDMRNAEPVVCEGALQIMDSLTADMALKTKVCCFLDENDMEVTLNMVTIKSHIAFVKMCTSIKRHCKQYLSSDRVCPTVDKLVECIGKALFQCIDPNVYNLMAGLVIVCSDSNMLMPLQPSDVSSMLRDCYSPQHYPTLDRLHKIVTELGVGLHARRTLDNVMVARVLYAAGGMMEVDRDRPDKV